MADTSAVVVKPRGTSWLSVIGGESPPSGWPPCSAPIAGGIIASRGGTGDDISLAVPVVLAVMVAYLAGGYVAGRMAGYSTSWHGMMTAFSGSSSSSRSS